MMGRFLTVLAAFAILAAAAVGHGLRTDRWGPPADLKAAADRLSGVPMTVGDWHAEADDLDPRTIEVARVAGYLNRRYVHYYSKDDVSVLVLCGRPGPTAVHTPDVCYTGAGYVPGPVEKKSPVDGHTFWVGEFTKSSGPTPEKLRIWWAWSDGGNWTAADSPRTAYAGSKVLYKLYVVHRVGPADDRTSDRSAELDLIKVLLPELQKCLGPSS
jgi:hypothetical protein